MNPFEFGRALGQRRGFLHIGDPAEAFEPGRPRRSLAVGARGPRHIGAVRIQKREYGIAVGHAPLERWVLNALMTLKSGHEPEVMRTKNTQSEMTLDIISLRVLTYDQLEDYL